MGDVGVDSSAAVKAKDPTKRPSFAEKLMGVRNSQCEQYLQRVQEKIEHEETRNIQKLRDDTNRITYDLKTMKVLKKKRDLEVKKKKNPYIDTEQDEFEIMQAERYLVFDPSICFYTNKKNIYPLRSLAKLDPYHVTPTVAKARKLLQDMTNEKKVKEIQQKREEMNSRRSMHSVRFQTPDQDSYQDTLPSHHRFKSADSRIEPTSKVNLLEENKESGENLVHFLKRQKLLHEDQVDGNYKILADDIPDDFTQCHPSSSKHIDKTQANEDEIVFLPIVTSEERSQMYMDSNRGQQGAVFGSPEPNMSIQRYGSPGSVARDVRQTKSAGVRMNHSIEFGNRRYGSRSAASIKRQQSTHAMLRKENKEVETKVQNFLHSFERGKKHGFRTQSTTYTMGKSNKPAWTATDNDNKVQSRPSSPEKLSKQIKPELTVKLDEQSRLENSLMASYQRMSELAEREKAQLDKRSKSVRGIPRFSASRANRNSATYKLRILMNDLLKNRTKQELLEYEKMKSGMEQLNGAVIE